MAEFPKQGVQKPWKVNQNYALDLMALRFGSLNDGILQFSKARPAAAPAIESAAA
jgi:monooxygenase